MLNESINTSSGSVTAGACSKRVSRQVKRANERQAAKARPAQAHRPERSQPADCTAILAQCTAPLSDASRAYYRDSLSDDAAARRGASRSPLGVINDWIAVVDALLSEVLAGRIAGYGPGRMRYAAELAVEVATRVASPVPAPAAYNGEPTVPAEAPAPVDASLARGAAQGLRNLGIHVDPVPDVSASATQVSEWLVHLAGAVHQARETVPLDALADAGLTPEVVDSLAAAAQQTMRTQTATKTAQVQNRVTALSEDMLAGRLRRETQLLLASVRSSRKSNRLVPDASAVLRKKLKRKAAKTVAVAPPAVAPAVVATPDHVTPPVIIAHPSG